MIAGPDDGFLSASLNLVEQLGINKTVTFTGPLDGTSRKAALAAASAFAPAVVLRRLQHVDCGGDGLPTSRIDDARL